MLAGVSRRTENIAYQSTRTVRRTRLPQGTVKRLSLAVLVDQTARWEGTGKQRHRALVPPAPETLKAIRDLVAGVAGLSTERGDQLTVEALPFETTLHPEGEAVELAAPAAPSPAPTTPPKWLEMLRDPKIAVGAIAGALVAIGAGVFLWLRGRKQRVTAQAAPALASADAAALTASLDQQIQARLAEQAELEHRMEQEALSSIKMPKVTTKKTEVLLKQVREQGKKDSSIGTHVLRAWIGEVPRRKEY
jgi:flagellar M-ring protein FliF